MILFISFLKSLWAFERRAKGWKLCVFVTAHIKKLKKKITLCKFWDKIQDSCSWDLPLSCAEGQSLLSSLCSAKCLQGLPAGGRRGGIWGCCCCQLSCWLCSVCKPLPSFPLLIAALCVPWGIHCHTFNHRAWIEDFFNSFSSVQRCDNLCGADVAWLSVLGFPVRCSLSLLMCGLHEEHLNFQHNKLCQKSLHVAVIVHSAAWGGAWSSPSFYFLRVLFAFIILYVLSGVLLPQPVAKLSAGWISINFKHKCFWQDSFCKFQFQEWIAILR